MEKALKTYKTLVECMALYNFIAEQDILYWWNVAKDDDYDSWLTANCEEYGIEPDYRAIEGECTEEIYYLERELKAKLETVLIGKPLEDKRDFELPVGY